MAQLILLYPDVRRMLLTQKAFAEGNRALAAYCMQLLTLLCMVATRLRSNLRMQNLYS